MKDIFKGVAIKVLTALVIVAILAGVGYFCYNHFIGDGAGIFGHKTESSTKIVKEKLKATAELNTGSYLFTVVKTKADSRELKKWNIKIPLTEKSFTVQYDGTIKAGIKDLTKAEVTQKGEVVTVKLPKVEITGSELDNDSFEVKDESNNIFNPISIKDLNEAQKELKKEMIKNAKEKGVLNMAKSNAETVIKAMLESPTGNYEIKIEWQ